MDETQTAGQGGGVKIRHKGSMSILPVTGVAGLPIGALGSRISPKRPKSQVASLPRATLEARLEQNLMTAFSDSSSLGQRLSRLETLLQTRYRRPKFKTRHSCTSVSESRSGTIPLNCAELATRIS